MGTKQRKLEVPDNHWGSIDISKYISAIREMRGRGGGGRIGGTDFIVHSNGYNVVNILTLVTAEQ